MSKWLQWQLNQIHNLDYNGAGDLIDSWFGRQPLLRACYKTIESWGPRCDGKKDFPAHRRLRAIQLAHKEFVRQLYCSNCFVETPERWGLWRMANCPPFGGQWQAANLKPHGPAGRYCRHWLCVWCYLRQLNAVRQLLNTPDGQQVHLPAISNWTPSIGFKGAHSVAVVAVEYAAREANWPGPNPNDTRRIDRLARQAMAAFPVQLSTNACELKTIRITCSHIETDFTPGAHQISYLHPRLEPPAAYQHAFEYTQAIEGAIIRRRVFPITGAWGQLFHLVQPYPWQLFDHQPAFIRQLQRAWHGRTRMCKITLPISAQFGLRTWSPEPAPESELSFAI